MNLLQIREFVPLLTVPYSPRVGFHDTKHAYQAYPVLHFPSHLTVLVKSDTWKDIYVSFI